MITILTKPTRFTIFFKSIVFWGEMMCQVFQSHVTNKFPRFKQYRCMCYELIRLDSVVWMECIFSNFLPKSPGIVLR